jgi:hypothetical protein
MKRRRPSSLDEAQVAEATRGILDDYRRFLASAPQDGEAGDSKAFAARHAAARSALAHLEQLLKLAGDNQDEDAAAVTQDCIAEARQALATLSDEESTTDGEAG